MLQAIRDRASGMLSMFIIAVISIIFASWGIQDYFTTSPNEAVATVNGEEIALQDFQQGFSNYRRQMQQQFGNAFDGAYFDQPMIRRQFLDQMINTEIVLQAAEDAGLAVTAGRLAREIDSIDAFKVNGVFNSDVYLNLLSQQGMTPAMFEDRLREDLLVQEMASTINSTGFSLPGEVARLNRLENQQRSFAYFSVSADEFSDEVEVSEEEIVTQYEDNEASYMSPEQVIVEYLELTDDGLDQEVEVSEGSLEQRYEEQKMRFVLPERRLASHILIEVPENSDASTMKAAEERAAGLVERARAGEPFEQLARENSDDVGSRDLGGDLDWIEKDVMVPAFEEALFAMEPGTFSDPVFTPFGVHVIWLREVEESRGKSYQEAREELLAEYLEAEVERRFLDLQDRLYDLSYEDPGSLEPAADALGLEIQVSEAFGAGGGPDIARERQVIEAAFSDQVKLEGTNSDPLVLAENRVVVLRVREHILASLKPLEDVREQINSSLVQQKARKLAEAAAEELLARTRTEGGLDAVGEATEREVTQARDATRNGTLEGVDRGLTREVFTLPKPEEDPVSEVIPFGGNRYAVLWLYSASDAPAVADGGDMLSNRLNRGFASAEVAGLNQTLREAADIVVLEDRIQF
ncbi:MAG: SurA N-terminal domain-containing protein [Xanthomonadales bacterium]|nr:SurA N-terminal domain-containing protein [Xanthomonadales bacterium]